MSEIETGPPGALGPGRIEPRELEQEMRSSYLDYAMSVIRLVPLQVMLPSPSVVSTKREAALACGQGGVALARARVGSGAA